MNATGEDPQAESVEQEAQQIDETEDHSQRHMLRLRRACVPLTRIAAVPYTD